MSDEIQELYGWHKPAERLPSLPKIDFTVISVTPITKPITMTCEEAIKLMRETIASADPYRKRIVSDEVKKPDSDRAPGSESVCGLVEA